MQSLHFNLEYEWEPFTLQGRHLTFEEHRTARLNQKECSHWGAAIYKREGVLTQGEHAGKVGILVGESDDLRQRIKQYVSGTQPSGNKYWREEFLTKGDIYLYVLRLHKSEASTVECQSVNLESSDLGSGNVRLVLEQLLVLREPSRGRENRWIVNRKL